MALAAASRGGPRRSAPCFACVHRLQVTEATAAATSTGGTELVPVHPRLDSCRHSAGEQLLVDVLPQPPASYTEEAEAVPACHFAGSCSSRSRRTSGLSTDSTIADCISCQAPAAGPASFPPSCVTTRTHLAVLNFST